MAFTYDLTTDTGKMRFHLQDTVEASAKFTDAELAYAVTEAGTWQAGCILALDVLMGRLAVPDYQADWLEESNHADAAKTLRNMQRGLRLRFGIAELTATAGHVYRADSNASEAPTYD